MILADGYHSKRLLSPPHVNPGAGIGAFFCTWVQGVLPGRAVLADMTTITFFLLWGLAAGWTAPAAGPVSPLTLSRGGINVHLVQTPGGWLMIDTGRPGTVEDLEARLRAAGLDPARDLAAILLTHGHADHAGNAEALRQRWGVSVIAGAGDAGLLHQGHNDSLCPTNFMARRLQASFAADTFAAVTVDHWVRDSLDLTALGLAGWAYALPGHTPGSLVLVVGDYLFCGDLLRGHPLAAGRPALHYYMCDPAGNRADIRQALARWPAQGQWYPGHFGPLPRARVAAYAAHPE